MSSYRPRKYKQLRVKEWAKVQGTFDAKYYNRAVGAPQPFSDNLCDKWRREGWRYERQPKIGLLMRVRNSHNSPLCIALVTDLLLRTEPEATFSALSFTTALWEEFPHIMWDQYTVGRILRNLCDEAAQTDRINDQLPPVASMKWGGLTMYMVNASRQNWWWLGHVREAFGQAAQAEWDSMSDSPTRDDSAWAPIDTVPKWGDRGTFR